MFCINVPYLSSVGSVRGKSRSTRVSSNSAKKKDPSSSSRRGRGARRDRLGVDEQSELSNLPTSNLPEEWEKEKGVSEEKRISSGMLNWPMYYGQLMYNTTVGL